ncbi:unnamed protein product [Darwinula stevensoni]|uniref:DOMON domain-containing protein n=1 Tax=Darwinula stevensoni TaxID=69355 RepID=A0A7R8XBG6_9CRUS|nr:unnamed protein product [Darwinula stevensoni]CAG0892815.1 unnamed protein product [Darwinula stevensoni]
MKEKLLYLFCDEEPLVGDNVMFSVCEKRFRKKYTEFRIPLVLGQTQTWERHESLDQDGIVNLYWTPDLENGEITFELHAKTQGWAGLGFSANGAMTGSDIVVGWIKDGQTFFTDRHAVGNELPLVDESQDYELLFASEDEEGLTLRFKRLIDTCDEDDFYITSDTWSLIYAYGETDPDEEDPFYHGRDHRGVHAINLLDPQIGLKEWGILNDIIIPPIHTSYWCSVFKAPQIDTKQHIIGYLPWVTKGNEEYVHHFTLLTCTVNEGEESVLEQFMQDYPKGSNCFDPAAYIIYSKCRSILSAWAVGGVLVPPGLNHFMSVGHCPGECTEILLPPEGIQVFAAQFHAHLLECELDSLERDLVTPGGFTTYAEMCQLFFMYYPKLEELNQCASNVDYKYFHTLFQVGGIHLNPASIDWEVDATNQTLQEHFRDFDWEDFDMKAYQEAEVKDVTYPEYESDYEPPPRHCPVESPVH